MVQWTFRTLLAERTHLLASIGAIAGAFALVLFFEAIFAGESEQIVAYIERTDADVWVMQDGVSNMHMASSFVSDWKADVVRDVPGVAAVAPILYLNTVIRVVDEQLFAFVVGLESENPRAGPWSVAEGKATPDAGEVIVPAVLRRLAGVRLGDTASIAGKSFTVAGFSEGTFSMANSVAFVTLPDLSDIMSSFGTASYLLVDAESGVDPADLAARIEDEVEKVTALPATRFVENDWEVGMQMGLEIVSLMTVVGGALATLLTGFTVYVSIARRERELAVIKALGFRNRAIYGSALLQAAVLVAGSLALAVAIVMVAVPLTASLVPQVTLRVIPAALIRISAIAVAVALVSSTLSVRRLTVVDPVSAFRG